MSEQATYIPERVPRTLSLRIDCWQQLTALSTYDHETRSQVIERLVRAEAAKLGLVAREGEEGQP